MWSVLTGFVNRASQACQKWVGKMPRIPLRGGLHAGSPRRYRPPPVRSIAQRRTKRAHLRTIHGKTLSTASPSVTSSGGGPTLLVANGYSAGTGETLDGGNIQIH